MRTATPVQTMTGVLESGTLPHQRERSPLHGARGTFWPPLPPRAVCLRLLGTVRPSMCEAGSTRQTNSGLTMIVPAHTTLVSRHLRPLRPLWTISGPGPSPPLSRLTMAGAQDSHRKRAHRQRPIHQCLRPLPSPWLQLTSRTSQRDTIVHRHQKTNTAGRHWWPLPGTRPSHLSPALRKGATGG